MKSDTEPLVNVTNKLIGRVITLFGSKKFLITYSQYPIENKILVKLGSFNRFLRPIELSFILEASFEEEGIDKLTERHLSYLVDLIKKNNKLVNDIKAFTKDVGYDWQNLPSIKDLIKLQPFEDVASMKFKYPVDILIFKPYNQILISKIRKSLFSPNVSRYIDKKIDECINHFFTLISNKEKEELHILIKDKISVSNYCYVFEPIVLAELIKDLSSRPSYWRDRIKEKMDYSFDLKETPLLSI